MSSLRPLRQKLSRAANSPPTRRALHLHHVHLPSPHPTYTPYALASAVQSSLAAPHHAHKAFPLSIPPPNPSLLSFTPPPTYTLGRRQRTLHDSTLGTLSAPLTVYPDPSTLSYDIPSTNTYNHASTDSSGDKSCDASKDGTIVGERGEVTFTPEVLHSQRGGQTTYHGPGQLILWPILDLRSPLHKPFSVRDYAALLEDTTASLLASLFSIQTVRDPENPGLWIPASITPPPDSPLQALHAMEKRHESEERGRARPLRKIAAIGIHLRRHVATLGLSLNLEVPTSGEGGVNPWARFEPCGIPDREVTSVATEVGEEVWKGLRDGLGSGEAVAGLWAGEFVRRIQR